MSTHTRPQVLVVEDDEDSRDMLVAFLASEGYDVVGTANAEEGMEQLRSRAFGMVVSDYRLPGRTGAWMLRQAREAGLLRDVGALLWSADTNPEPVAGVKIVKKPVDLDTLLLDIEGALVAAHRDERLRLSDSEPAPTAVASTPAEGPLELVLYVTDSLTSMRAIRNLKAVLQDARSETSLRICHLVHEPLGGVEDRVAFTPMLVRRKPLPRESLLGDLRDSDAILELLRDTGGESSST